MVVPRSNQDRNSARLRRNNTRTRAALRAAVETLEVRQLLSSAPTAGNDPVLPDPLQSGRTPYTVVHGQTLTIDSYNGVLANDHSQQQLSLTASVVTPPTDGTLTLNSDGSFTYAPTDPHFVGTDSFTYVATDANGSSAPATATVRVTDQAPQAQTNDYAAGMDVSTPTDPHSLHSGFS